MWRQRAALPAVLPLLAGAFNEVIEFDAYRAVPRADLRFKRFENADFADIPGLLDYLHTKVILEHSLELDTEKNKVETEERTSRVNSIDTVVRLRMKVRNPATMMQGRQATHMDFGPAVQFVEGQATGAVYKWDYGDFVGIKKHSDDRLHTDTPYYWFSFSGFCPNLPFLEKYAGPNRTANEGCVNYKDGSGPLLGGFCPDGHLPTTLPTGKFGCVYAYEEVVVPSDKVLNLDDLVGITQEDCGGRPCKDWLDFRNLCTNKQYKQKFQYSRRRRFHGKKVVPTPVCVEYDIDPDCAHDCNSHACKRIPEKDRELGLPFWRGRCDKQSNRDRYEKVAEAFGIKGATTEHTIVEQMKKPPSCQNQFHTACQPYPEFGGMYCTRAWAGVCQECYIPNAVKTPEKADKTPYCPWNVLDSPEYAAYKPTCASSLPRDICCIYAGTCNVTTTDPAKAPINNDGYWLIASQRNTEVMEAYLTRVVQKLYRATIKDPEGVTQVSYREWDIVPRRGRNLEAAIEDLKPYIIIPPTTTTGASSPLPLADVTVAPTELPRAATTATPEAGTPIPSWIWWLLGGILAACVVCGLLGFFIWSFFGDQEKRKDEGRTRSRLGRNKAAELAAVSQEREGLVASASSPAVAPVLTASATASPLLTSQQPGQVQYIQTAVMPSSPAQQGYYVMAPQPLQSFQGQQVVYLAQPQTQAV